jgi:PTS system fructose-specific IIC component
MEKENGFKDFFGDIRRHLMSGISYMLPLIVTFALFMVLGQIPGSTQDVFTQISNLAKELIVPVLATFIAYSIAGKPTIATGLVIGLLADKMGMGFIGGLIVGLLTGYFVKLEVLLLNKIKGGGWKDFLVGFLVIPIITPLVLGAFTYFVIANPVSNFMVSVNNWLTSLTSANAALLAMVLGAMIAVDMGGPINKIAYTFALAAFTEGAFAVSTPVWVAISIPTWSMALAANIAPKKYSKEEKAAGKNAIVMGIIGLTEGTIPFAAVDPLRVIPCVMVGSAMGAVMASLLGVSSKVLFPSFLGLTGVNKPILYLVCHIVPTIITALLVNALKKNVVEE